jgi:asparagine synthase (glutamine-hydrolysing)
MLIGYLSRNRWEQEKLEKVARTYGLVSKQTTGGGLAADQLYGTDGCLSGITGFTAPPFIFDRIIQPDTDDILDGAYAYVLLRNTEVFLTHDCFGAQPFFYTFTGETLWFSSDFAALLQIPEVKAQRKLNLKALHAYLACSFVPAPYTLFENIYCVPPNTNLLFRSGNSSPEYRVGKFGEPKPAPSGTVWIEKLTELIDSAMQKRLAESDSKIALSLSGGLDSSAVAAWLKKLEIPFEAFHLDFADIATNPERPYAEAVAQFCSVPFHIVTAKPDKSAFQELREMVRCMPQPFGDPAVFGLWLVNRAIAPAGFSEVFNGEGGDQLFAGWPNKAMFTAELYSSSEEGYDRAEAYLRTFHHFYGLEQQKALYGPELAHAGEQLDLRELVRPYLEEPRLPGLFERLRWTNYWLKGSQNIMPRAAMCARSNGLRMQTPLFDLELSRFALQIPGELLLNGANEKYLLKETLRAILPLEIIERQKQGMSFPAAVWLLGEWRRETKKIVGKNLVKRGIFRQNYIKGLLKGEDLPAEIRSRRVGEKLWQLMILELWLQYYLDNKEG